MESTNNQLHPFKSNFWFVIICVFWGGLLIMQPVSNIYDRSMLPRPWISAHISLDTSYSINGAPLIHYTVTAQDELRGQWQAWVSTYDDAGDTVRECGGNGLGSYSPSAYLPSLWAWRAFLGAECSMPDKPFRICASYNVETESGARGRFGPYCSEPYDPNSIPKLNPRGPQ